MTTLAAGSKARIRLRVSRPEPRHREIEDDGRRPFALHAQQRLEPVRRRHHLEPLRRQVVREHLADLCVVIDD